GRHGPTAVAACVVGVGVFQNTCAWINASAHTPQLSRAGYFSLIWSPMAICIAMLGLVSFLREMGVGLEFDPFIRLVMYAAAGALFYVTMGWMFARRGMEAAFQATRIALTARSAKA